jgi:DedD protein
MAWFKFGKKDDGARGASPRSAKARTQASTDSVEAMRQKAKFRLIGSIVLVLAAVVGFPMLFDSQPRTVPVDIPIDIPDKAKVAPLPPVRSPTNAPSAPAPAAMVDDKASLSGKEEIVSSGQTADKPNASASVPKAAGAVGAAALAAGTAATPGSTDDAAAKAAAKAKQVEADKARKAAEEEKAKAAKVKAAEAEKAKRALEASRAKALLDDQTAQAQPAEAKPAASASAEAGRFIVQFGAFTDVAKSREVRQKVEKAGLKTYSQVAKTADGERIRVRVGPFASRAEAEKAAAKIKALDLPASILTL